MALTFFIIVPSLAISREPLTKLVVTIMGNISGVKPTAVAIANINASTQSPFVNPLIRKTVGVMTNIKRISTHVVLLIPVSKLVCCCSSPLSEAIRPNKV